MIDFCTTLDAVELHNEVDHIIQQIDILFNTYPEESLGMPEFGTNYSQYLHELNIGSGAIADVITQDIYRNINLMGWRLEVEVNFMVGTLNDIMLIAIQFHKDSHVYSKVYKITEYQDNFDPSEYVMDA